jgi:1-acyl-sn-glycerol-3-phosphate acyltransferase
MLRASYRLARLTVHFAVGLAAASVMQLLCLRRRQAVLAWWARGVLAALGVRVHMSGAAPRAHGLVVANHVSWLDVVAVCAARPALFVCKSEIAAWPAIGWLLRRAGMIFIRRRSFRAVWRLNLELRARFMEEQSVAAFPESTTTEGHEVLPFKPGLFQPAVERGLPVYPMAIAYSSSAAAFVGEMTFVESLLAVAAARALVVQVAVLPPLETRGLQRREVAERARDAIRARLPGLQLYAGASAFSKSVAPSRSLSRTVKAPVLPSMRISP